MVLEFCMCVCVCGVRTYGIAEPFDTITQYEKALRSRRDPIESVVCTALHCTDSVWYVTDPLKRRSSESSPMFLLNTRRAEHVCCVFMVYPRDAWVLPFSSSSFPPLLSGLFNLSFLYFCRCPIFSPHLFFISFFSLRK